MQPSEVPYPADAEQQPLADDCRRCAELPSSRTCLSWGNGPTDASVVVVGEAPAAGDPDAERWRGGNLTGMAYTSRASGRKVRALVADAGYAGDAYYTNAVKCHPPGNRDPTGDERANCRPWLREELDLVAPDAVVPTGKHATESVFALAGRELSGFLDVVLDPIGTRFGRVVPVLHPSYEEVWRSRLGYDREGYVAALADALDRDSR